MKAILEDKEFVPFKDRSGVELPEQYVIALQWTALTPSTPFEAIWDSIRLKIGMSSAKPRRTSTCPLKIFYTRTWKAILRIKCRATFRFAQRATARSPRPGWTDEYEWTGYIPFDERPTLSIPQKAISSPPIISPPRDYPSFHYL